jgi:hypothetical protein
MGEAGRSAFIVANDEYADRRLSRLRAPAADAQELANVLRDPEIGGFDVDLSLNEPEHIVRRRLSAFFENRGIDDLLLVHLSCHGVKDEDGRLYFATTDTETDHLDATSIPSEFLNRLMTRSRSRRVVLLLDCCYSGAFARGWMSRAGDRVDIQERFDGRGRIVLTASSAMEYSFEGDQLSGEGRPSVFTSALVEGLSTGEADRNRDGYVSVDELYDFAYDRVREVTPSQTPGKWVFDVQGDFHVARSRLDPVDPAPPQVVSASGAGLAPAVVEPAAPRRVTAMVRVAALALLAVLPMTGLAFVAKRDDGWNLFAVLSPIEAAGAAIVLWLVSRALGGGRLPTSVGAGGLTVVGALCLVGSVGLVKFSAERISGLAVALGAVVLLGSAVTLAAGVVCIRTSIRTASAGRIDPGALILALAGAGLAFTALFLRYDGFSSLSSEVGERASAEFFFEPALAVVLILFGLVALGWWPGFGAGALVAVGAQTTVHFLGVLVAAWRAVGEVGNVGPAGFIGLLGGILVAAAGEYARAAARATN